jgi:hypothetical protein
LFVRRLLLISLKTYSLRASLGLFLFVGSRVWSFWKIKREAKKKRPFSSLRAHQSFLYDRLLEKAQAAAASGLDNLTATGSASLTHSPLTTRSVSRDKLETTCGVAVEDDWFDRQIGGRLG